MKDVFKKLIKEFHEQEFPKLFLREYSLPDIEEIVVLIGLRRTGKTYQLFQKIKDLQKSGIDIKKIIFINFEDERLIGLKTEDLNKILEAYCELYPENINGTIYLFFDEIQAAQGWSLFLKRIYETKQYRIFVTGSSSKLLSKEIATELRGRTVTKYIYPLSFNEFLNFKGFITDKNIESSKKRFALKNLFNEYLQFGGYPLVVKYNNPIEKEETLTTYIELIIYKDLIERYGIRNLTMLKNLIKYAVTNISKTFSLNSFYETIKKETNVSKDAIGEYFSYLEDAGFLFTMNKFSNSLKKQIAATKKIYIIDNGFKKIFGFDFSTEFGRLLENLAFIELKRRHKEVFYHSNTNECDFIIKEKNKITSAIQVTTTISKENEGRELAGLLDAMEVHKLDSGLILTYDDDKKEIKRGSKKIKIIPLWQWLLEEK